MSKIPFVVRVESSYQAALRANSVAQGRPLADVMTEAIQEYLERRGAQIEDVKPLRLVAGRPRRKSWPDDLVVVVDDIMDQAESA